MRYPIRLFGLLCVLAGFVWLAYAARAAPDQPAIVGGAPVPDPNPYVWQVSINQLVTRQRAFSAVISAVAR